MKQDPRMHHRRSIRLQGYDYQQPGADFVTICACRQEVLFGQIVNGQMQLHPLGEIVIFEWFRSAQLRHEIVLYSDEFVLMPNHLHGIVHLVGADGICPDDPGARNAGVHDPGAYHASLRPDDIGDPVRAYGIRPDIRHDDPGARNAGAYHAPLRPDDPVRADGIRPDDPSIHDPGAYDPGVHRTPLRPDDLGEGNADARRASLRRDGRSLASFIAGFKSAVTSRAKRELDLTHIWQRNYYEHIIRNEADYARILAYIQTNPLRWEADQLYPAAAPDRFDQE